MSKVVRDWHTTLAAATALICFACPIGADVSDARMPTPVVTILTWGGAYQASQQAAYFEPFTHQTGIEVRTARYDGGIEELRHEVLTGSPRWDVVDLVAADAQAACEDGLLEPFDADLLAPMDGTLVAEDFDVGAIGDCWVAHSTFSTVLAYDVRAFPGEKPRRVRDFFDLERFPGKRALQCAPIALLEWALLAYEIPYSQVYDLLSTPRGLELAFRKLDLIAPQLVWWHGGDDPVRLLRSGEVAMSSGYNGRFFAAQMLDGPPISIIWDGQLLDHSTWAVPRGAVQRRRADAFIRFATSAQPMAEQAMRISYAPTRESARRRVGQHVDAGVDMNDHLPTSGERLRRAVIEDSDWYARTQHLRQRRFAEWRRSAGMPPCDSEFGERG